MYTVITRAGITPVGSPDYRLNRLRFHLLSYAIARNASLNGRDAKFYIRADDTDKARVNPAFLDSYLQVLDLLRIRADKYPNDTDSTGFSLHQSERGEVYRKYLGMIEEKGLIIKHSSGALLFDTEKFSKEFNIKDFSITVHDLTAGEIKLDIRSQLQGDLRGQLGLLPFPLSRSSGEFLFNFCSPVDDAVMGITHIVRDKDKLDLLAKQEMIRISLDLPELKYLHAPVLVNQDGNRFVFDETLGDATFQNFRTKGFLPTGIVSYLLSGFYGNSEDFHPSIDEFAKKLQLGKIHKANTTFSLPVLRQHNKRALGIMSRDEFKREFGQFALNNEPNISTKLAGDSSLVDFLFGLKRDFENTLKMARVVTNSDYDETDTHQKEAINKVLSLLPSERKGIDYYELYVINAKSNAERLDITYPDYCKTLVYILSGTMQDVSLKDLVKYRIETDTVVSRIEHFTLFPGKLERI